MFGNDQCFIFQFLVKSGDNRFVIKNRAGEDDLMSQFTGAYYLGQVIFNNRVRQAGRDYFQRYAFLPCGGHCLTHKRGAFGAEINCVLRRKCQIGEIAVFHGNAQRLRHFIDEATGACCAGFIHLVIDDQSIPFNYQLGILSAEFDDIGFRVNIRGGSGLRCDFILNQIRANQAAD